jgi:mannitol-1-phosphate/altronate dehydrogenase
MSFTEDELQSFNTILEQRLTVQRKEMERIFEQRIIESRRDSEQRFFTMQQEILRNTALKLTEMQGRLDSVFSEKLQTQQTRITQAINLDAEQKSQQVESSLARLLEAQLPGIEKLLSKQFQEVALQSLEDTVMTANGVHPLQAFEVQTELPWEDLSDMIGKALDERLSALSEAFSRSLQNLEQYLSVRIHGLRDEFVRSQPQSAALNGSQTSVQEVLHGIEHLERVVESLQVAMTANHALLSNRLYHHQQLPLERAHPGGQALFTTGNGQTSALTMAKDRVARGLEPESTGNVKVEEHQGL